MYYSNINSAHWYIYFSFVFLHSLDEWPPMARATFLGRPARGGSVRSAWPVRRLAVVPSERRALAKSKRAGGVREYLIELDASGSSTDDSGERAVERWFYQDWLRSSWFLSLQRRAAARAAAAPAAEAGATAPQSSAQSASGAQPPSQGEPPAADSVADDLEWAAANFWSLDNPLIAAPLLIGLAVAASAAGAGAGGGA